MSAFLAGIPGQVKTLLDRLTSGRATNLDNLDATVSSRAPSSTALSTATWTGTRATNLDNLNATVSSRAPSSTALSTATWTSGRATLLDNLSNLDAAVSSVSGIPQAAATGENGTGSTGSNTYVNLLNITSDSGALMALTLWVIKASSNPTANFQVHADGVNVFGEITLTTSQTASDFGNAWDNACVFQINTPIIFTTSLRIEANDNNTGAVCHARWAILKD